MLRPADVRIGNALRYQPTEQEDSVADWRIAAVTGITDTSYLFGKTVVRPHRLCAPVELTKEVLINNFAFEKHPREDDLYHLDFFMVQIRKGKIHIDFCQPYTAWRSPEIKYVHDLQNYFYYLQTDRRRPHLKLQELKFTPEKTQPF